MIINCGSPLKRPTTMPASDSGHEDDLELFAKESFNQKSKFNSASNIIKSQRPEKK